jgi:hypothetical protein
MNDLAVEHIDPRNGVLVSGLENEFNEVLAESVYNGRKTNRFVPYRVKDYPAPINEGDLGEFLIGADILTGFPGEWVICEFMVKGGAWWGESNRIGNSQTEGGKNTIGKCNEHTNTVWSRQENGKKAVLEGKGIHSQGYKDSEERKNLLVDNAKKMNGHPNTLEANQKCKRPVLCIETGVVYPSVRGAERLSGVCRVNIRNSIRTGYRAGGHHWKYI